jgi:hypothetical protein
MPGSKMKTSWKNEQVLVETGLNVLRSSMSRNERWRRRRERLQCFVYLEPYLFVLEEWSGFWREFTTSIPPPKESFIGLFVAILIAPF